MNGAADADIGSKLCCSLISTPIQQSKNKPVVCWVPFFTCPQLISAVQQREPSLAAMNPIGMVKAAEERARKIVGIRDKNADIETKRRADEAKRLASLNVRSNGLNSSPTGASGSMWDNDSWHSAYDRAQKR